MEVVRAGPVQSDWCPYENRHAQREDDMRGPREKATGRHVGPASTPT